MDGTRPQQPLSDAQLDRELEMALGVEPSSEFVARVRTRVAIEPQPLLWRLAWWGKAVEPVAAVAIVGIVLAVLVPRVMREERAGPHTVAVDTADTPRLREVGLQAEPVRQPALARSIRQRGPQRQRDMVHTLPLQLSPVLFAEDDRRAFALFVTAVTDGTVPEEAVQLVEKPMTALVIEPLEIAPLQSLARVAQEGEGRWE